MSMRSAVVVVSQCLPHGAARVQATVDKHSEFKLNPLRHVPAASEGHEAAV